jgi:hypothetical protein
VNSFGKVFVDEESTWHKLNRGIEQNIDGFYTKTTQKRGFSKLCVKVKKRCYTDLLHFSTRKHNFRVFFRPNHILTVELHRSFLYILFSGENAR